MRPGVVVHAGLPVGVFDSDEPFWTSQTVSTTYAPICRNSLSQFSKVASTKWPVVR